MFEVKVILHSQAPCGKKLMTLASTFPRVILAEVNTHRDRARNAASSRAIPFLKMSESVMANPFIPLVWGGEQSGMQTAGPIPERMNDAAQAIWLDTLEYVNRQAHRLHHIGETYYDDGWAPETETMTDEARAIKIHK
jgi:hypothetical protein